MTLASVVEPGLDDTPAGDAARPRWQQIGQAIAATIGPAGLRPGARLPTEAQLAAKHGCNRHTVRRAVESLVRTGLVRVEQGRGAFVCDDRLSYAVTARTRFSEWVRRENREPEGRVLNIREQEAAREVAAGLGVEPGHVVALQERLGLADGVPVSLACHWFDPARLPGILQALRTAGSITAALAAAGVPDYVRRTTRVSARMPTAAEAGLLQVARARPVLVCENTNVDTAGGVVEFCIALYPSSRVQVVFEP